MSVSVPSRSRVQTARARIRICSEVQALDSGARSRGYAVKRIRSGRNIRVSARSRPKRPAREAADTG
eukprot:4998392-Pyramimonas_sp.AAC.1